MSKRLTPERLAEDYVEFNLNNYMLVKVTEEGYKAWHEREVVWRNRLPTTVSKEIRQVPTIEELKAKADANGYTKFQGWHFVQIFGPSTTLGTNPFHATVLLKKEDLVVQPTL
ncbi:hypothetical protein MUN82_08755 [Hymenobacter aerilatus]|uniref:Uncharacterized protein n=1 Tax=Hymenobacter aerilatus TaxID=2932251 RepID=A0A8T9SY51_9BACT|nr:hypothetical protein [Hymenobacter aerilatus]UOR07172.1 hypothetical protein MUN82_08755 [Hymenobacter aerilatus]